MLDRENIMLPIPFKEKFTIDAPKKKKSNKTENYNQTFQTVMVYYFSFLVENEKKIC